MLPKKQLIFATNHHTPYVYMLCRLYPNVVSIGNWEYRQRSLPSNCAVQSKLKSIWELFKNRGKSVVILNGGPRDLIFLIYCFILKIDARVIVHGNILHGYGRHGILFLLKKYFIRMEILLLGPDKVFTIAKHAVEAIGDSRISILYPVYHFQQEAGKKFNNKLVVASNNLDRAHFSLEFLRKISATKKFQITICGKNNEFLRGEPGLVVVEPRSQEEYFEILKNSFFCLNILKEPESNFNMSFLDCIAAGCLPILIERDCPEVDFKFPNFLYIKESSSQSEFDERVNSIINKILTSAEIVDHYSALNCFSPEKYRNTIKL